MDIIVIGVALYILVLTFVFGILNKYRFNRVLAEVLGGSYIIFIIMATIIAVKNAI